MDAEFEFHYIATQNEIMSMVIGKIFLVEEKSWLGAVRVCRW